jgi:SSS family solute:Na+ symporter
MSSSTIQVVIFVFITALIAFLTFVKCRSAVGTTEHSESSENKEIFLAGGNLSWIFVAGSITLTNLSTDQLVGMNGNQMLLVAWWEFAAVIGLIVLAKVFLPVYYKYECTTTTELLEKRFGDRHIRALISVLFLLGNVGIFIPAILYGGSL